MTAVDVQSNVSMAGAITALIFHKLKQLTIGESLGVGKTRCVVGFLVTSLLLLCLRCVWSVSRCCVGRCCDVCSLSESAALRMANTCPEDFVNHNKRFLSRVFPNRMRVDSSNYNPQDLWNCGCHLGVCRNCVVMDFTTCNRVTTKHWNLQWAQSHFILFLFFY